MVMMPVAHVAVDEPKVALNDLGRVDNKGRRGSPLDNKDVAGRCVAGVVDLLRISYVVVQSIAVNDECPNQPHCRLQFVALHRDLEEEALRNLSHSQGKPGPGYLALGRLFKGRCGWVSLRGTMSNAYLRVSWKEESSSIGSLRDKFRLRQLPLKIATAPIMPARRSEQARPDIQIWWEVLSLVYFRYERVARAFSTPREDAASITKMKRSPDCRSRNYSAATRLSILCREVQNGFACDRAWGDRVGANIRLDPKEAVVCVYHVPPAEGRG
jgi:hypothetical protein